MFLRCLPCNVNVYLNSPEAIEKAEAIAKEDGVSPVVSEDDLTGGSHDLFVAEMKSVRGRLTVLETKNGKGKARIQRRPYVPGP